MSSVIISNYQSQCSTIQVVLNESLMVINK